MYVCMYVCIIAFSKNCAISINLTFRNAKLIRNRKYNKNGSQFENTHFVQATTLNRHIHTTTQSKTSYIRSFR